MGGGIAHAPFHFIRARELALTRQRRPLGQSLCLAGELPGGGSDRGGAPAEARAPRGHVGVGLKGREGLEHRAIVVGRSRLEDHAGYLVETFFQHGAGDLPPPRLRTGAGRELRHDQQHGPVKLFFLLGDAPA